VVTHWTLPPWPAAGAGPRVHTIHLLGAESSGKTQLSLSLAQRLRAHAIPCALVSEHLRDWVTQHQRTPRAHEQAAIAAEQAGAIVAAHSRLRKRSGPVAVLIADTSPLMTAIYSAHYFDDPSGVGAALAFERGADQRLLMGLDLPWQADPGQRDGPAHRDAIDQALRHCLREAGLPYPVIYGSGQQRTQAAWLAVQAALVTRTAPTRPSARWQAACDCCADPACELALFTRLTG
jgi:HTH-type transcriptional regulator, transcriptional repressor of NAD biosynthesis genes